MRHFEFQSVVLVLRPRGARRRRNALAAPRLLVGVVALLLTTVTAATAASSTDDDLTVEPGEAYMGVGTLTHEGADADPTDGSVSTYASSGGVQGIDVSAWQNSIDWDAVKDAGIQFAWIKATEGSSYTDSRFDDNYPDAYNADVIRGAYHFALPDDSSGSTQATYFVSNGGAWSADDLTLPGVLDIEGNPYGSSCYGLSTSEMRDWITDFYDTYASLTGRDVVIYTSPSWWNSCTGDWGGMSGKSPLWVAHWTSNDSPTLPSGFSVWTVWQYTSEGSVSGVSGDVDRDKFNGSTDRLLALANDTG